MPNLTLITEITVKIYFFTSSKNGFGLLNGWGQNAEGVVERSFGLVKNLFGGTPENDGTSLTQFDSAEFQKGFFTNINLKSEIISL